MPIYRLLEKEAFQPELIAVMGDVFDDVLLTLHLVDRKDPLIEMIAKKIIELAQTGERNPERLRLLTLAAFNAKPAD